MLSRGVAGFTLNKCSKSTILGPKYSTLYGTHGANVRNTRYNNIYDPNRANIYDTQRPVVGSLTGSSYHSTTTYLKASSDSSSDSSADPNRDSGFKKNMIRREAPDARVEINTEEAGGLTRVEVRNTRQTY